MFNCPGCHGMSVREIHYGKPGPEMLAAQNHGLIELGGCVLESNNPNWHCLDCDRRWAGPVPSEMFQFVRGARDVTLKYKYSVDTAMDRYGAACIAYGECVRRRQDSSDAYQEMMRAHRDVARMWDQFLEQIGDFQARALQANPDRMPWR